MMKWAVSRELKRISVIARALRRIGEDSIEYFGVFTTIVTFFPEYAAQFQVQLNVAASPGLSIVGRRGGSVMFMFMEIPFSKITVISVILASLMEDSEFLTVTLKLPVSSGLKMVLVTSRITGAGVT